MKPSQILFEAAAGIDTNDYCFCCVAIEGLCFFCETAEARADKENDELYEKVMGFFIKQKPADIWESPLWFGCICESNQVRRYNALLLAAREAEAAGE